MKTAIYARTKSLKQIDKQESIQKALARLESFCAENKLKIVRRYYDIGSGKGHDAVGWNQLLQELESGKTKVKRLVCCSTDRYSQHVMELMQVVQSLNRRGIQIIFIDEQTKKGAQNKQNKIINHRNK